jgi:hypothetical protein
VLGLLHHLLHVIPVGRVHFAVTKLDYGASQAILWRLIAVEFQRRAAVRMLHSFCHANGARITVAVIMIFHIDGDAATLC